MVEITADARFRIANAVWRLMDGLVRRDDNLLAPIFERSRVEIADAYRVIDEYGHSLVSPPLNAYQELDLISIGGSASRFAGDAYLWGEKEKPTDLSVEITLDLIGS